MCFLRLNQELSDVESKPRMGFHHLEKGNAASSEDALALDSLSQPMLPGESVNRKRYIEDCFFFLFFFSLQVYKLHDSVSFFAL